MRLDSLLDGLAGRRAGAVLLGGEHLDDLASASQDGREFPGFPVGDRPGPGAHRLAEAGEDLGVDLVGLGEPAGGPGEVAGLAGIDHRDRDTGGGQSGGEGALQAPGALEHHHDRARLEEPAHERVDADLVVGGVEAIPGGAQSDVQASLGDVHPCVNLFLLLRGTHRTASPSLWPILADAGSSSSSMSKALATVRAPPEDKGATTLAFRRSLGTKETTVCRARYGRILRPKPRYKEMIEHDEFRRWHRVFGTRFTRKSGREAQGPVLVLAAPHGLCARRRGSLRHR